MRAPLFWNTDSWMSRWLLPISSIYRCISRRRHASITPQEVSIPVICIGNLVTGGAGKTPVAIALMDLLKKQSPDAWFLSRGYGGKAQGPLKVEPYSSFADVGDEPILLSRHAPVMVAKDRAAGARAAQAQGASLLIMDDGFQNPSLKKDFSILVIDGAYGLGNERIIPAGPLRESMEEGLARADAVVIIGEDTKHIASRIPASVPVFRATTTQLTDALDKGQKIFAFAGIGRPEKFHVALRDLGFYVTGMMGFPDHHAYSAGDIAKLKAAAAERGACLVTTEKDAARLPEDFRSEVKVVGLSLSFNEPEALRMLCLERVVHVRRA